MSSIGKVESLCRYPVKSMAGETLEEAFIGYAGVYGDRVFAFLNSRNNPVFPWLSARDLEEMLGYRPRFRHPEQAALPVNLALAQLIPPGLTPAYAPPEEMMVDVTTTRGEVFAIDDPALRRLLGREIGDEDALTLVQSERALTDCRPISLIAMQTLQQIEKELDTTVDPRRFRANIYLDLDSLGPFGEETLVGRPVRIGDSVVIAIVERDPRCKIISLDPDTGASNPEFLRNVVKSHDSNAGVYGAVLTEGVIRKGDNVELLD